MTPNTGSFDMEANVAAMDEVMQDVKDMTGKKSIYVIHRKAQSRLECQSRKCSGNRCNRAGRSS